MSQSQIAAIIPAAGSGERLGIGVPKALVEVAGQTLIQRAVHNLSAITDFIVIAAPLGHEDQVRALVEGVAVHVVSGGERRSESVANALKLIPANVNHVLIHDAARAFAPTELARRVVAELIAGAEAVVPAIGVIDTIKVVDAHGYVVDTPDRNHLRAVQTPQGFTLDAIKRAHSSGKDATDDAALVAELGIRVKVIEGDLLARKITTLDDLLWARELVGQP